MLRFDFRSLFNNIIWWRRAKTATREADQRQAEVVRSTEEKEAVFQLGLEIIKREKKLM